MLVNVEGVVLGKRDIGESNCFLDILTNEYGVIEVAAHGIKKAGNKNSSACDLFSYSKFCLNKSNLHYTLNSSEPKFSFFGLSSNLKKFSLAVYFADIIKFTSAPEQEEENILRFFAITLFQLEKENSDCLIIKSTFELKIAAMLGFMPDLKACRECGNYLGGKMFFSFENSNLICSECKQKTEDTNEKLLELSNSMLEAMRFVVFSPIEKVYFFTLKGRERKTFSDFSEKYILAQLNRGFKTLDYYKNIEEFI